MMYIGREKSTCIIKDLTETTWVKEFYLVKTATYYDVHTLPPELNKLRLPFWNVARKTDRLNFCFSKVSL